MYPDWPKSDADLVPLPLCDGPKLESFDFRGPQKIEFLQHLGDGLHAHVFKVKILGQIYALKLFKFVLDDDWLGPADDVDPNDLETMTAFYNYSDPFSCECRAFGRLQEAGHDDLAIQCFGYLFLDEAHERTLLKQFSDLDLDFNGYIYCRGGESMRSRFVAEGARLPPIRGIVKELGQLDQDLRTRDARRILRDVVRLHQLGIIHIDVASRQLIGGKICDFSTAITTPHFITTPELNQELTPEWISALELETFQFSCNDYWDFDEMVRLWNEEHEDQSDISVYAFPAGRGCKTKYALRSTPSRERVYSLVDPRLYDWRTCAARATRVLDVKKGTGKRKRGSKVAVSKTSVRLNPKPPRWYLNCDSKVAARLRGKTSFSTSLQWVLKDGLIFPWKTE